jgi:putative peptidoglycan lipid II flippase
MPTIISRIRRHLADPLSNHRRIAIGFLWVGLFVLVGKLAGAAKEMAIAWRYGVSETVDAYVFIFNLISWPVSVWFSVLTVVLVPLVARVRHESPLALPRFRSELLGVTLAVGIGLGVAAYFGLPLLLSTGWAGFSGSALQQALAMAGPLTLLLPMGMVISLFSAWLMANGHHRNTLLEVLPALAILGALLMPPNWVPEPLIWGSVAGFTLQLAGLGWPMRRAGELQRPALGFHSPAWQGFWRGFGVMAAGQALLSVTGIIDQFFAAHLGPGAITTLSYANRIISLIVALGSMAISRSTLPIFSELAGQGKSLRIRELSMRWSKVMLVLGFVCMIIIWLIAPRLVQLLFQRGAFTPENTLLVTDTIRYLLLQLPFNFAGIVLSMNLTSMRKYPELSLIAGACFFVKLVASFIFVPGLGLFGIAVSTAIMYLFAWLSMYLLINHR